MEDAKVKAQGGLLRPTQSWSSPGHGNLDIQSIRHMILRSCSMAACQRHSLPTQRTKTGPVVTPLSIGYLM